MARFWVSWAQPTDDYRPLHDPPKSTGVLGWWCSGYDSSDRATLCASVEAENADAVRDVLAVDWPEVRGLEWRFIEETRADHVPGDRFPIVSEWSRRRFGK